MFTYESEQPKNMGPHGLGKRRIPANHRKELDLFPFIPGDPDDFSLRKVETEILIPKIMRDRAKTEKCIPEVQAFEECCKDSGIRMVYKCRSQNDGLKTCLAKWYKDEQFKAECRGLYLKQRSEYRRTGVKKGDEKK